MSFLKWLLYIVTGIFGLFGIGYLITEMVVADYPEQFTEADKSLVQEALKTTHGFLDNPIERILIQKCKIVSLEFNDPPKEQVSTRKLLDDSKNGIRIFHGFVPKGFPTSHLLSNYKVKISAYTLFAIHVTTVSVSGNGPSAGSIIRLRWMFRASSGSHISQ